MRSSLRFLFGAWLLVSGLAGPARAVEIESNGIIWTLAGDPAHGTFVTGDPWVVGPVKVTGIRNTLNSPNFTPKPGQNGSMVNPGVTSRQGYDSTLASYDESLNAGLINGNPVSADQPLELPPGSTLVSMVSWLYNSPQDGEPGIPRFNGGTDTPRPATRSAGVLTVLDRAPEPGSFRPPYSGSDKTVKFNQSMLDYSKLPKLEPVGSAPNLSSLAQAMAKPWIDHVNEYLGAFIHPSEHMPNYGRDMGEVVVDSSLALLITEGGPGANPDKDRILRNLVQFGIDLTGIADQGGGWPANGGHHLGRKWPILFAGTMLNDPHMKNVGKWETRFQENEQTFYVTQAEVDLTHSPQWKPDKRAELVPYSAEDIGMAEWGIRHATKPETDNRSWDATYREVNGAVIPGFALAARLMGLQEAWNHDAFFDYCDRYMKWREEDGRRLSNTASNFLKDMWTAHRAGAPGKPAAAK